MLPPIGFELSFSLEVIERRQQSSDEHRQGDDVSGAGVFVAVVEGTGGPLVALIGVADAEDALHLPTVLNCFQFLASLN